MSITHDTYQSLDQSYGVRGVFLDISKVFDKVWHKGSLHKLEQNDFFKSRKQNVVLNCHHLSWNDAPAGVLQGSILDPLLFLIYINVLSDSLQLNPEMFTDDTLEQCIILIKQQII